MRRTAMICAAILAVLSVGAPSALAARKPAANDSVLLLKVVSGPDLAPSWGDDVTFEVKTSATPEPHVELICRQSGTVVYGATAGFFDGYAWPWTKVMNLRSQQWSGGGADCTARLYYFDGRRQTTLRTETFRAEAS